MAKNKKVTEYFPISLSLPKTKKITEYFTLRKSNRNVPAALEKEKQICHNICQNDANDLKVCESSVKDEIGEEGPKKDTPKEDVPKEDVPKEDAPKEDAPKKDTTKVDKIVKVAKAERITDHLTVRKSSRKPASTLEKEKQICMQEAILTGKNESLLNVYTDEVKGRGIKAAVAFKKNDFVVEYKGNLIEARLAAKLEQKYAKNESIGSYMYFFKHKGKSYCVDATKESPFKARLINHSVLKPNLKTKVVDYGPSFHLILLAIRDIEEGEELLYDYGDRTTSTVAGNPWLLNT
uniref:[histone H4]-lysine(20) N-methyltransferase n=1 Tax=Rhabditophanes sp. KR3021 TaxID=114890 RepID=A0AC35TLY9_9BILA